MFSFLGVALMLPSCSAVQNARDSLAEMSQEDYSELTSNVSDASAIAGERLKNLLDENQVEIALLVTQELFTAIEKDSLDAADLVKGVVDQYGLRLGLNEEQLGYIRDAAKIIDAAVGQISLGIDGELTLREKGLLLALLAGIHSGLQ
jgi:division protein CdvB (Snf7/Vps24/ESCRT-III family)